MVIPSARRHFWKLCAGLGRDKKEPEKGTFTFPPNLKLPFSPFFSFHSKCMGKEKRGKILSWNEPKAILFFIRPAVQDPLPGQFVSPKRAPHLTTHDRRRRRRRLPIKLEPRKKGKNKFKHFFLVAQLWGTHVLLQLLQLPPPLLLLLLLYPPNALLPVLGGGGRRLTYFPEKKKKMFKTYPGNRDLGLDRTRVMSGGNQDKGLVTSQKRSFLDS